MKVLLFIFFSCLSLVLHAQKVVRTHYDAQKQKIQEEYRVAADGTYEGPYRRYFETGTVMLEGHFKDGEKSGVFKEYHESGNIALKITYVNGMRHGVVEVFEKRDNPYKKLFTRMTSSQTAFRSFLPMGTCARKVFLSVENRTEWSKNIIPTVK